MNQKPLKAEKEHLQYQATQRAARIQKEGSTVLKPTTELDRDRALCVGSSAQESSEQRGQRKQGL